MRFTEQKAVFDDWLSTYKGVLFKVVRAYATKRQDQEDLFQEIATQVWISVPGFEGNAAPSTWIYRVALNTAISWSRKEIRRRDKTNLLDGAEPALMPAGSGVDPRLDWLYEQIAQLNELDRSLTLLLLDGFSYKEMADALGMSETNVGVRIRCRTLSAAYPRGVRAGSSYTRGAIAYTVGHCLGPVEQRLAAVHLRKVRSFVRRPGRITAAQRRALDELMPRFGIAAGSARLDLPAAFGRDAARVLDVGFGDGEALLTSAANHPELDYLGVEVHEPGIGHLLLLLEKSGLTNVRLIARDAAEVLPELLPDGCLAAVNLFFPDPWPKKRHHKRRLVQPPFISELARALRPGGLLHVATDWADYARHCREIVALEPRFAAVDAAAVEGDSLAFRPPTKFERRGLRLGHDVVDLYYRARE